LYSTFCSPWITTCPPMNCVISSMNAPICSRTLPRQCTTHRRRLLLLRWNKAHRDGCAPWGLTARATALSPSSSSASTAGSALLDSSARRRPPVGSVVPRLTSLVAPTSVRASASGACRTGSRAEASAETIASSAFGASAA
jgi:hypothetical protein